MTILGNGALLVATDVAARGLDIAAMARVLVYDFGGVTAYTHQIGRTGRAGRGGEATCFYVRGDGEAGALVETLERAGQAVPRSLLTIAENE
jgi:superfamily II DNA/RNA helicase